MTVDESPAGPAVLGGSAGGGSGRLRVVVFTAGTLAPINRVFFERLAKDQSLDVCALIVDDYQRARKPLLSRLLRGLREEGWSWLWFKFTSGVDALIRRAALFLFELMHRRTDSEESYDALSLATGIPVHRVPDIHSEPSLALIASLRPQLGVIVGGRILRDAVTTIPEYGTLNIHKRKVPEYRGGGPIGYWEVLAGESSMGVTIHYAVARVDEGAILADTTIPIEACDTLESLQIKADLAGARLYHDAIRRIALGDRRGTPQDTSRGRTYKAPGEFKAWQLHARLQQKAARMMPPVRTSQPWVVRARVFLQYAMLLPLLLYRRKRLLQEGQAPICIFYYHVVANHPVNHMCLRLDTFVQQMEFLRRYYSIISLDEAVQRLRSGQNDRQAVAITFDDGYQDNEWAIEYLRYFGIPATFFVSIGHVRDGCAFEHDHRRGFTEAPPMSEAEVRRLAADGFTVGSHGIYHEDLGALDPASVDRVLQESRQLIGQVTDQAPEHFSFPKGQLGKNITAENFALAQRHYRYIYSAYGGHNRPQPDRRHFLRERTPTDVLEVAMVMDGYMGFRACLAGNAWGLQTDAFPPYWTTADDAHPARLQPASVESRSSG